jgi:hypothetical protein
MNKTSQDKILQAREWASNNKDKTKGYKQKYKTKIKNLTKEYINQIKCLGCCKICGISNPACLDFHHREPSNKKNTICNLQRHGYRLEIIKQEIEKCDLICSNCHRTSHYTGLYKRNKKMRMVLEIKSNNCCLNCGCNKSECLDFHHLKNKDDGIGVMIRDSNVPIELLKLELEKCIILCSNCHRILHASEREKAH